MVKQQRAVVTGAAGFLGGEIVRHLLSEGWAVATIGHGRPALPVSAAIEADVSAPALLELLKSFREPDLLVHAAGTSTVGAAAQNAAHEFGRTVGTMREVLTGLREAAPDTALLYPSSVAVYGNTGLAGASETDPCRPMSRYAEHKLAAERLCLEANAQFGLRCVILRYGSVYGPGLRKQLFWDLACRLGRGERRLVLSGTGEETRDFLEASDAARLAILAYRVVGRMPLMLNAGTGVATPIRAAAELFAAAWHPGTPIVFDQSVRPSDPMHLRMRTDRAKALGFRPHRSLAEGIPSYVAWARKVVESCRTSRDDGAPGASFDRCCADGAPPGPAKANQT